MLAAAAMLGSCSTPMQIDDPVAALAEPGVSPRQYRASMDVIATDPTNPEYVDALLRLMWVPGYTVDIREEAFVLLEANDREALRRTIRQQLPRMSPTKWHRRLCELIAELQWVELSPALVSSWAWRPGFEEGESDRIEQQTLAQMYGEDEVIDVVYDMFVASTSVSERGLRTRCWVLLHRLGQRDRLMELLSTDVADDDVLLLDLQAAATELGIVPFNREEILWLQKLRTPQFAAFWSQAVAAIEAMPPQQRLELELRDVPTVVAAWLHDPALLESSSAELYAIVEARLRGARHYDHGSRYDGLAGSPNKLRDWRGALTWGDLAAIMIMLQAMETPQVVSHLFDYAERDRLDKSSELGGVIRLDEKGRLEVLEFPPRIRRHDREFIASQEMVDAAYTSQFHFHFHAQDYRNTDYAGPGFGDKRYADATRANCIVMTFVNRRTMNVDFYRHGRVVVDLGVITLPDEEE